MKYIFAGIVINALVDFIQAFLIARRNKENIMLPIICIVIAVNILVLIFTKK